jgi:hypothetical protein
MYIYEKERGAIGNKSRLYCSFNEKLPTDKISKGNLEQVVTDTGHIHTDGSNCHPYAMFDVS